MIYLIIGFLVVMLTAVLTFLIISIGLQEANDPSEARPEDLWEFEKRHVHRTDLLPRGRV